MNEPLFTLADVLGWNPLPERDVFEEQLCQSYSALLPPLLADEDHPRQITREEYRTVAAFLAGHNGNPLAFLLGTALRRSTDEALPFLTHLQHERLPFKMC